MDGEAPADIDVLIVARFKGGEAQLGVKLLRTLTTAAGAETVCTRALAAGQAEQVATKLAALSRSDHKLVGDPTSGRDGEGRAKSYRARPRQPRGRG